MVESPGDCLAPVPPAADFDEGGGLATEPVCPVSISLAFGVGCVLAAGVCSLKRTLSAMTEFIELMSMSIEPRSN